MNPATPVQKPRSGNARLPPDFGRRRDELMHVLKAATAMLGQNREENLLLWLQAKMAIATYILDSFKDAGLHAPPWQFEVLKRRINPHEPPSNPDEYVNFVYALMTNCHELFWAQFDYRHKYGGNVHLDFSGLTGMAKSSCAGDVANDLSPIEPARLLEHFAIDQSELPKKLVGKRPRQTVVLDEDLATAGEGSRTLEQMIRNIVNTLRFSGVNFFTCSPELEARGTTQGRLEVLAWNPEQGWTLFLLWVGGLPVGLVALDWMPAPHYAVYSPWKASNTERTMRAIFRDTSATAKEALRLLEDPRVQKYLGGFEDQKPRIGDFEDCVLFWGEGMQTSDQAARVSKLMMRIVLKFAQLAPMFKDLFGVEPSESVKRLASKWEGDEL